MPYNEKLAARVQDILSTQENINEKKMFGGIAFLLNGNMCCGVVNNDLLVRVGEDGYLAALKNLNARQMDFTGKPLKGFVFVAPPGVRAKQNLINWIELGLEFVQTLPAK